MSYRRGRNFEYRVRNRYARHGFFSVRASSSKGTPKWQMPIDIVAIKDGKTVLIECKMSKKSISRRMVDEHIMLGKKYGVETVIVYRDNNHRMRVKICYSPYNPPVSREVFS